MNEKMKDQFVNSICLDLIDKIDTGALETVKNAIWCNLHGYTLARETSDLAVYDQTQDQKIYELFFATKKIQGFAKGSIGFYQTVLRQFLLFLKKPITEITSNDIKYYLAHKSQTNTETSLNNIRRILMSFFTFCQEEDFISRNPMVRVKKIKERQTVKKPFTETEVEKMRRHCKDLRDSALLEFLYSTGCRISEATGLVVEDLDLPQGEAKVLGKGNKERTVYLSVRAVMALTEYVGSRDSGRVFLQAVGKKPLQQGGMQRAFQAIGARAGIPECYPHKMRRTTATMALHKGMELSEVRDLLGHANIQTTTIYAQADREEVKRKHGKYF